MLMLKNKFWVDEKYVNIFNQHNLHNFNSFNNYSRGVLIRSESEKTVQFIELDSEEGPLGFFIKRERLHLLSHLKNLVKNRRFAHLATRHELDLIRTYQRKNFPVVEPVAWGEQRFLGAPSCGFLVQKEVAGHEFVDLMKILPAEERIKMIKAYSALVASLHSEGLVSSVVRATDLIVTSYTVGMAWNEISLVIIDREKGPLVTEKYCLENASNALSSIVVRFMLYIRSFTRDEIDCFFYIYFNSLKLDNLTDVNAIMHRTQIKIDKLCVKYSNLLNNISINILDNRK